MRKASAVVPPCVFEFIRRRSRSIASLSCALLLVMAGGFVARAAISVSTSVATTQSFDGMGTAAAATLPADFRVDKLSTVRAVGTFAAAGTATSLAGGANLSTSASNGIYNFGAGTTTTGPDRAVGFLSSGTATFSGNLYAQLVNNTDAALTGLQISYNVEKYRHGSNGAGFRIQLFYSTDGSNWTNAGSNFLTSFGADADNSGFSTAPGITVAVTNQNLKVNIQSGSNFYLAWNYSVATGTTTTNAQALAIDDISITGIGGQGPTNPAVSGTATPGSVQAGNSTLLTATVTPGTNPASTGLAVTADLSSIGGSATQQFIDNGGSSFSFQASVPANTSAGLKTLPLAVADAQGRSGSGSISLTVTSPSTPPAVTGSASPSTLLAGNSTLLTVNVTPGTNPTSSGIAVTGDLSAIGGSSSQQFGDNGNGSFSYQATVASGTSPGSLSLPISITDAQGRKGATSISLTIQAPPPPTTVKISQVYGGGGNSGSTYTNDFVELFNQDVVPINISAWSVQYNSAGSTTGAWQVTPLCAHSPCLIQPHHYYLVKEAQGANGTTALPLPDAVGDPNATPSTAINMSATNGKVALVATTVALTGSCPLGGNVVDLVGYGTANCSETAASAVLSNTTAAVRRGNGCLDTDNNSADFVAIGPIPRNSSSPVQACGGDSTVPFGLGISMPAAIDPASNVLLSVAVSPATLPPSTGIKVSADLTSIGGEANQQFYDDGTHGDVTAGDNVFSFQANVAPATTTGSKSMIATITDAQERSVTAPITLTVTSPSCGVERWSVKVGTDPDAPLVNLNEPLKTTIGDLITIPPPATPPDNARVLPAEGNVYVVNATMTFFKKETDVDYHIVIQDDQGRTMVTEIPSPACLLSPTSPRQLVASPFSAGISTARAKFDSMFTPIDTFQQVSVPVQIKGVGFFDFLHGQNGVAPNGIELHPILEINFTANTTTTPTSSLNPSQYGQTVTMTATVSNGSTIIPTGNVTFTDGTTSAMVPLDNNGLAAYTTSTLSVGSHSFTASYDGDSTSASSTSSIALVQVVNKADQTIAFNALPNHKFGDADFNLSATASSGLPVRFSVASGPASIAGNTVHITGAGSVTVRASQPGDGNYNPAEDVDQSFTVSKADQVITFSALADKTYGDAPFTVSATGGGSVNPVMFAATGSCTANGKTITITSAGSCTVMASQAGDQNYNPAADVARSFTVNRAAASISVNGYSGVYDAHPHGATGTATGVNAEDLSTLLALGQSFTAVPGGTAHWTFAGNTNYGPASGDVAITITQATVTIRVSGYAGTYDAQAHGATGSATGVIGEDLSALLNLGIMFTDVPGGTALWSFAGNTNYQTASGSVPIVIVKATAALSNLSSPTITIGTATTRLSGSIMAGSLVPTGIVAITVNSLTQNATIQPDGSFSSDFSTSSLAASDPAYSISYSYAGSIDFNAVSGNGTLTVGYNIVPLFDKTKAIQSGSTVPVKIALTNNDGGNLSSPGVLVTALRLTEVSTNATNEVQDSGNANPDNDFRFDALGAGGGYIFNLSTKGLTTGTYALAFKVAGDPQTHTVLFQVR